MENVLIKKIKSDLLNLNLDDLLILKRSLDLLIKNRKEIPDKNINHENKYTVFYKYLTNEIYKYNGISFPSDMNIILSKNKILSNSLKDSLDILENKFESIFSKEFSKSTIKNNRKAELKNKFILLCIKLIIDYIDSLNKKGTSHKTNLEDKISANKIPVTLKTVLQFLKSTDIESLIDLNMPGYIRSNCLLSVLI